MNTIDMTAKQPDSRQDQWLVRGSHPSVPLNCRRRNQAVRLAVRHAVRQAVRQSGRQPGRRLSEVEVEASSQIWPMVEVKGVGTRLLRLEGERKRRS